jgi:ppGpp synthetase/RelA/SpoT-type nucleotidyltranferase
MVADVISEFIRRYRKEFDYYQEVARLVAQQCESELEAGGIRAIVTHRAKRPDSLLRKLRGRATSTAYAAVDDVYSDIHDLAGVRIALYFPGDRQKVEKSLLGKFNLTEPPKTFPNQTVTPAYAKRFSGYWAAHYRLRLNEADLLDGQKRYADAKVEVQVASVLMHAWAEVEHDLVYKPETGTLSIDEYAVLDELNGLVLAGEIALERLQRAFERRVERGGFFGNHYELAAFLYEAAKPILAAVTEPVIGRVDILFQLLLRSDLNSPAAIEPFLKSLEIYPEHRPIADQIIDQIIAADPLKYEMYAEIRRELRPEPLFEVSPGVAGEDWNRAIGEFMARWILFERVMRALGEAFGTELRRVMSPRGVAGLPFIDRDTKQEIERIRRVRNNLVHGVEVPDPRYLIELATQLKNILDRLANDTNEQVRAAVRYAIPTFGQEGAGRVTSTLSNG